ncbi:2-hydroxyacid dehydrogenase [Hyphococcus luteus]|uniref:D-glycerate dehydrogenase n=1 Tax=Hyphococcus luteus TaxID=2058213 RepID=A0A2S7K361_9PROT|nr:D-glycerate dehydrogenase [Marinicaulis flavus]PQA86926.1 D-glycerate dehydrogenase [Marinicaulis flavus]
MKVLLTRRWPKAVEDHLSARFDVTLNKDDTPMSAAELSAAFDAYDVICPTVSDKLDAGVIGEAGRRAKLLANFGVGFDHIDIAACEKAGVKVANTPSVLTDATADLAMTLMLMAARRAGEGEREVRAGAWTGWRPTHLLGRSVTGKTLGLVGFGRIAQATAKRARDGFGMTIVYFSRRAAPEEATRALDAKRMETLDALLATSDFVSLHVPGGTETQNMIGAAELARMKPDAVLINTARGGVVNHDALATALKEGPLAAAALDVYPQEPKVPEALLALENVVLMPHLGSATEETRTAMGMRAAANVEAFASGAALPDPVV